MNDKINEKLDNLQKFLRLIVDIIFLVLFLFLLVMSGIVEKLLLLPIVIYFVGRVTEFFKEDIGKKISKVCFMILCIEAIIYLIMNIKI